MRHICMTPSNAMSSDDARKVALKFIEFPIIQDYLSETHGVPESLNAQVPNDEDWWDTLSKRSYCQVLNQRHKTDFDALMATKNLPWPDLSTFNGPTVLRFAFGDALKRPPSDAPKRKPGRCEYYEIKPDNFGGEMAGRDKLRRIEDSYDTFALRQIYQRGFWYPIGRSSKRIPLKSRYAAMFKYLMNLYLPELGTRLQDMYIMLRRSESGVLLYKLCVDLDGMDQSSNESVWRVANWVVRMFALVNNLAESKESRRKAFELLELEYGEDFKVTPTRVPRIIAGRDLTQVPFLQLKPGDIAPEVSGQLSGIATTMYSRLMGKPGERYFICADESWYVANVMVPGLIRIRALSANLGTDNLVKSVHGVSMLGVAPTLLLTAKDAVQALPGYPLVQWALDHAVEIMIVVTFTVLATALVIVTAGAAAPIVPAEGVLLTEAAGVGLSVGETSLMAAPVIATTTVGADVGAIAGAPLAGAEADVAADSLLTLCRTLANQATASEVRAATAQQVVDNVLIRAMTNPGAQAGLKAGAQAAVKFGAPTAALALVGLSPSRAYAYTGSDSGPVDPSKVQDAQSTDLGVGRIYILRVPGVLSDSAPKEPALYNEFPADAFIDRAGMPFGSQSRVGKLRMLGSFRVT
jgi:hypothetical protein